MYKILAVVFIILSLLILSKPSSSRSLADVMLVLAIDNSRSVDDDEYEIQRRGYADTLSNERLHEILLKDRATVGLLMFEWGDRQTTIIPCMLIRTPEDFLRASFTIRNHVRTSDLYTHVGSALQYALNQVENTCDFDSVVTVLDISGDGQDNENPSIVEHARQEILSQGWTINTLPILDRLPSIMPNLIPVDQWYRENVQGGPFSFTKVAESYEDLPRLIFSKVIREVAEGIGRSLQLRERDYARMVIPY